MPRWLLQGGVRIGVLVAMVGCSSAQGDAPRPPAPERSNRPSSSPPTQPAAAATSVPQPGRTAVEAPVAWPGFRGPSGQGTSSARGLPESWDANRGVIWKTKLPGPGASSPVVWGDRVYLTCYSGYFVPGAPEGDLAQLKRHLVAAGLADGTIIWDRAIPAKLPEEERIRDHGYAASTPAVDADRVYVFLGKSGVVAFDHDGRQIWSADVGSQTHGWGSAASPVLYGDLVFINASVESGSLIALDRRTGQEKWRAGGIKESWNTPLIVSATTGRDELVLAIQGKVLGFDPLTGESLWSCDTGITWYMVPSLVTHDGVVYCLGGRSGIASLAVRTGGKGDVTDSHRLWTSLKGSNVSSPIYHDGHLYWAHDQLGVAYCARADTGEVVYQERLERAGQVYSSTLLADGKIYHLTRQGQTFVLAAKPQFQQLSVNDLRDGSLFNGSFAVAGSRLLVRSDRYLYCVGSP